MTTVQMRCTTHKKKAIKITPLFQSFNFSRLSSSPPPPPLFPFTSPIHKNKTDEDLLAHTLTLPSITCMTNPPANEPDHKARDPSQEDPKEEGYLSDKEDGRCQIEGFGFIGKEPGGGAVVA
jgi:hypothetical protein